MTRKKSELLVVPSVESNNYSSMDNKYTNVCIILYYYLNIYRVCNVFVFQCICIHICLLFCLSLYTNCKAKLRLVDKTKLAMNYI